jgi:uncharacterized membrane protein (DUF485 family)
MWLVINGITIGWPQIGDIIVLKLYLSRVLLIGISPSHVLIKATGATTVLGAIFATVHFKHTGLRMDLDPGKDRC